MNTMKKIQADKNGCKYILFRIDIYFSECFLAVEIDEKGHTDRDLIFEEKRQKAPEKNLVLNFNLNRRKENQRAIGKRNERENRKKMREKIKKELEGKNKNFFLKKIESIKLLIILKKIN